MLWSVSNYSNFKPNFSEWKQHSTRMFLKSLWQFVLNVEETCCAKLSLALWMFPACSALRIAKRLNVSVPNLVFVFTEVSNYLFILNNFRGTHRNMSNSLEVRITSQPQAVFYPGQIVAGEIEIKLSFKFDWFHGFCNFAGIVELNIHKAVKARSK